MSKVVSRPCFASAAAARRRCIFCCGLSLAGAEPKSIREEVVADGAADVNVLEAYGPVEVKRVASEGDRAMVGGCMDVYMYRQGDGLMGGVGRVMCNALESLCVLIWTGLLL